MTEGAVSCLSIALRCVGEAIKLDSENRTKEAYCQYLSCIIYISQVLKDDAWDKDMKLVYNKDTSKLFKLLQQCQERAAAIAFSTGSHTDSIDSTSLQQTVSKEERPPQLPGVCPIAQQPQDTQYLQVGHMPIRKLSDGRGPPAQQMNWSLLLPSPPTSPLSAGSSKSHTGRHTSMGKSQTDNQQLIVAYRMRMMNSNMTMKTGAPPSKLESMSKSLSVLRKMSENMAIAQARERALRKKLEERQQRVQEEANRRFGTSTLITKEEQEQRYIYTKILEFEQETVWPKQLRERLKMKSEDSDLISEIVSKIFSCEDHPLTRFLRQYQYFVYKKLSPLVKDVGFPDVESARRADRQGGSDDHQKEDNGKMTVLDETCDKSNDRTVTDGIEPTNSETEAKDKQSRVNENTDVNPDESIDDEASSPEEKYEDDGERSLVDGNAEEDTLDESSTDRKTSIADLGELRGLLVNGRNLLSVEDSDESKPSERRNDSEQQDSAERGAIVVEDDSAFHELEADMLEWENSDSDRESETNDERSPQADRKSSTEDNVGTHERNTDEKNEEKPSTDENAVSRQVERREESAETERTNDDCGDVAQDQAADMAEIRAKLNETLVDIRFFLEKLHKMTLLAYELLDTPLGRDQCYASLEAPFFKHLWPMLLAVLRRVNYDKEVQLANVMTEYIVLKPQDIGVRESLAMENQDVLAKTGNTYPYHMAVEELHKVVTCVCPLEKLDCLVRTSRAICQCVGDYWESMGKSRHSSESSIGCDDLLPILTFVIVKSGMAQLVSECNAMEEFIPEGYLMGEEGYCLTSLVTALAYLATLSK